MAEAWGIVGLALLGVLLLAGGGVWQVREMRALRREFTNQRAGLLDIIKRNLDLTEQTNAQLAKLVDLTGAALRRQATAAQCKAVADWVATHPTRFARRQTRDLLLAGLPPGLVGILARSDVADEDMKDMLYQAGNWNAPAFATLLDAIGDMLSPQSADGAAFADLRSGLGI